MVDGATAPKLTKNARRRAKKKEKRNAANGENGAKDATATNGHKKSEVPAVVAPTETTPAIDVEYVSAAYDASDADVLSEFESVFSRFATAEALTSGRDAQTEAADDAVADDTPDSAAPAAPPEEEPTKAAALSRKKRKLLSRMSVAELKQVVARPDAVEAHDVTAADPRLLVYLKSYRNAVPVPRHWCHKRRYLQGKRGVEKKPWQLPEFIAQTGIEKIRKAVEEAEALKKIKQKTRERVAPKMGRMDVDYQVLHDAFFKWQTKPKLSGYGEVYYEGKEFEVHLKEKKPGALSAGLKAALGMPDGAPPPWLINMQRYGPPPSYPNLRIPGLNAPIPEGASFGYHPGGWGKPPVDEYGMPLYGDVFGARAALSGAQSGRGYEMTARGVPIDRTAKWGELPGVHEEPVESDESDEDDDEDARQAALAKQQNAQRQRQQAAARRAEAAAAADDSEAASTSGIETPLDDGASSVVSGLETPSAIDLRKRAGIETPDTSGIASSQSGLEPPGRELYRVLDEDRAGRGPGRGGPLFGSDKRYRIDAGAAEAADATGGAQSSAPPADGTASGTASRTSSRTSSRRVDDDDDDDDDDDPGKKRKKLDGSVDGTRRKSFKF